MNNKVLGWGGIGAFMSSFMKESRGEHAYLNLT